MIPDVDAPVRLGIAGLGRGFVLTLPSLAADPRVKLVAAAAPRNESRHAFEAQFGGRTYSDVPDLVRDPKVEAIYVATPHDLHCDHVIAAASAGKHVLVDKPLAVTMEDGRAMVEAAEAAAVHLIVGPSHSFDAPVEQAVGLIASGVLGRVRMIQAFNYTDFLYRPRRPEELETHSGGGVLFSQAIHQVDVVRRLANAPASTVAAFAGAWDRKRPSEGAYAALIGFADGGFATLAYSGYGYFDSDEWMDGIGELGWPKDMRAYGQARRALTEVQSIDDEKHLKAARTYGAASVPPPAPHAEHFGPVIISGECGVLRLTAKGIWHYGPSERRFLPVDTARAPRAAVIDALVSAVRHDKPPIQSGRWGLASLEVCLAMLRANETGGVVALQHQDPTPRTTHPSEEAST